MANQGLQLEFHYTKKPRFQLAYIKTVNGRLWVVRDITIAAGKFPLQSYNDEEIPALWGATFRRVIDVLGHVPGMDDRFWVATTDEVLSLPGLPDFIRDAVKE